MRYSTEPKFRKYVQGYSFLSFATKLGDRYGKKLIEAATNTGIVAAKTASKTIVQKAAEATGNLMGNEIADKITSVGKTKTKEKEKENTNKQEEIYVPPEKRQKIINDLKLFWIIIIVIKLNIFYFHCHSHCHFYCHCHGHCLLLEASFILIIIIILLYKMKFQKIINLLDITSDDKANA